MHKIGALEVDKLICLKQMNCWNLKYPIEEINRSVLLKMRDCFSFLMAIEKTSREKWLIINSRCQVEIQTHKKWFYGRLTERIRERNIGKPQNANLHNHDAYATSLIDSFDESFLRSKIRMRSLRNTILYTLEDVPLDNFTILDICTWREKFFSIWHTKYTPLSSSSLYMLRLIIQFNLSP